MTLNLHMPAVPIVSILADDPDMQPLVHMFVDEVPEKIDLLTVALAQSDWEKLKVFAHQLKGSAAGYDFPGLTDAAAALERFLNMPQRNLQLIEQAATTVLDMLQRLRAA